MNPPRFKGAKTFGNYLQWQASSDVCIVNNYCHQLVGIIQFELDNEGLIDQKNLKISDNIEGCLRSKVRDVILSTNGQWEPASKDGQSVKSLPLIQLVYFLLDGGCTAKERYTAQNNLQESFESLIKSENIEPVLLLPPATVYIPTGSVDLADDLKDKN